MHVTMAAYNRSECLDLEKHFTDLDLDYIDHEGDLGNDTMCLTNDTHGGMEHCFVSSN